MSVPIVGYSLAGSMRTLLACPFCREMFEPKEAKVCPACGLALKKLEELPPAPVVGGELLAEASPDEEILPWTYFARGRGALFLTSLAGIASFFLPWVVELAPERRILSGPQIASHLGWMWAPLVAWMVMIPLVLSRRSVFRMRGARVAVAFLAGMALVTSLVRVLFKPVVNKLDPHIIEAGFGLYVNAAISLIAIGLAFSFGGRLDVLTTKKDVRPRDETLH